MATPVAHVTPREARALQQGGALLLDVRDSDEHATGMAEGALAAPRDRLEADPRAFIPDRDADIVLLCGSGTRSRVAAESLAARGYARLYSVEGGMVAWRAASLPTAPTRDDADFLDRYSRHLRLPQVGLEGQRRLADARVLLVGAGGLGSPVALYLAAAGVGTLRIVDDDRVERSNLQRQVLHGDAAIGTAKVTSATAAIHALNPRTRVEAIAERLSASNVAALLDGADVVVDGADNFPTRYLLSDACVMLAKPLVYGAVHRFEGQLSVFDAGRRRGDAPCYRCLFPDPPQAQDAPNCAEAGVLGVLPGIIGLLQATEVLKLLLGIGEPLVGRLLHVEALSMRFRETRLRPDPDCRACAPGATPLLDAPGDISCMVAPTR